MNSTYSPRPNKYYQLSNVTEAAGNEKPFPTPYHQETYIRNWLKDRASIPTSTIDSLTFSFYQARYHPGLSSIFSMGDILPDLLRLNGAENGTKGDVIILEEVRHCFFTMSMNTTFLTRRFAPRRTRSSLTRRSVPPARAPFLVPLPLPLLQVDLPLLPRDNPHQLPLLRLPAPLFRPRVPPRTVVDILPRRPGELPQGHQAQWCAPAIHGTRDCVQR